ncbi:PAS domain-containing sensor histidine kinase [Hoeflea sp. BAL378]|uniref:sensor histidine kinase n=1 Tax=Hoeflea sp. BAL378 TaxID=1547437 RepID=UPI0013768541|nr:PAS domain-containing sensor histidine kinase [Hoeflea sp. BAL378]
MMYQDRDLRILFTANLPESWPGEDEVKGKTDSALFGEAQASVISIAKREVLESGEADKLEIQRDSDQDRHWFLLHIDPDIDEDGKVIGVLTTILDIDDVKYRETVLKTLLRELSHRSKNLLAIIQSIASQTARYADDLETFLFAFRNRIQSMAQSQDLVTASDWRGAELFALTRSQLEPLVGKRSPRFGMAGEDAYLFPNAALHLGLALHELTIDSLAKGALGPAGGSIELASRQRVNGNGEPELVVRWTETFARPPDAGTPREGTKAGFSGTVLGRIVPQALSASVEHDTNQDRMVYQLTIPSTQYELHPKR